MFSSENSKARLARPDLKNTDFVKTDIIDAILH